MGQRMRSGVWFGATVLLVGIIASACAGAALPATPAGALGDTGQYSDMTVDEPLTFSGQVDGNMTVAPGGVLTLYGQVGNDLIIEKGGQVEVIGRVFGNVINRGGKVTIQGVVDGAVRDKGATTTTISTSATVGGETVP